MKASDITDKAFLAAIEEAMRIRSEIDDGIPQSWATRWDIAAVLAGHAEDVGATPRDYEHMPAKVVLAKADKLIERGLIGGCACGCRGDFQINRFGPAPDRIEVTCTAPAFPTFGELGWPAVDPDTTEKQIEAASAAIRERAAEYFESDAQDFKRSWARTGDWGNGHMEQPEG